MMTSSDFLEYVMDHMDPDEIVDEFGITSEELVLCLNKLLYARRYRIAYRFEGEVFEDLGYVSPAYDEEQHAQKTIEGWDLADLELPDLDDPSWPYDE
jgi:hypothetical protein